MADFYSRWAVFDVETVAAPNAADLLDPVKAPAHYKDPFKIAMYQQDKLAERIATASLEPDLCEVVALGFDVGRGTEVFTRAEMDERELLDLFWERCGQEKLVGFNCLKFDLPVLLRRSQLLGISYPHIVLDRYKTPHIDLLERLSFNGVLPYRSLNFYCRRFEIECPDDPIHGSDIPQLVADGLWGSILAHCGADVEKTRALAQRLGILMPVAA